MTALRRTLLAAEDSEAHRLVLSRIMGEVDRSAGIGLDLHFVENGLALLEWLDDAARPRPDLVLLDLHMPRLGGLEALRRLRGRPDGKSLPVVILSSSDKASHIDNAYQAGANAFLIKLGDHNALLAQMRAFAAFWLGVAKLPGAPA